MAGSCAIHAANHAAIRASRSGMRQGHACSRSWSRVTESTTNSPLTSLPNSTSIGAVHPTRDTVIACLFHTAISTILKALNPAP